MWHGTYTTCKGCGGMKQVTVHPTKVRQSTIFIWTQCGKPASILSCSHHDCPSMILVPQPPVDRRTICTVYGMLQQDPGTKNGPDSDLSLRHHSNAVKSLTLANQAGPPFSPSDGMHLDLIPPRVTLLSVSPQNPTSCQCDLGSAHLCPPHPGCFRGIFQIWYLLFFGWVRISSRKQTKLCGQNRGSAISQKIDFHGLQRSVINILQRMV